MCASNVTAKPKQKRSRKSSRRRRLPLEFSKKLTIIDIIVYLLLASAIIITLLLRPELGTFAQNIFAYLTTAYVSLRLGYTAKAGVENYKKIAENYKAIAELATNNEEKSDDEQDCESESVDEEVSLG